MRRRVLVHIVAGCVIIAAQVLITATLWQSGSVLSLVVSACIGVVGVHVLLSVRLYRAIPTLETRSELVEGMFLSMDDGTETPTVVEFYQEGNSAGFRHPNGDDIPPNTQLSVSAPAWFAPYAQVMSEAGEIHPRWRDDDDGE